MDSDQVNMVAAEPLKYLFWPKIRSGRWQCDREHCHDAASKCPQSLTGHDEPFSESFKELKMVLFINCLTWRHEFHMNNALTVEKTN